MAVNTTKLGEDDNGELHLVWPDGNVEQSLQAQIASTPQTKDKTRDRHVGAIGPVPRVSSQSGVWSKIDLRSFSLNSTELATTLKRFRDEMYRNQFPVPVPSFTDCCTNCGTEYDEERETCEVCGHTEFEGPSKAQKHWLSKFVEAVNDDGQSLASLWKYEEDYQSFHGVSTVLVRLTYQHVERDVQVAGRSVRSTSRWEPTEIKELVHADPTRLYPVLDEKNRHGGWWTCPQHRGEYWEEGDLTFEDDADHPTEVCPQCHAQLEEVGYAEMSSGRKDDVERLFLKHEVIDWARHFPIRNGLDGRSPILPLIKLQAILQWSRNYELQYLNPQNDQQLPDKFLVAYGKSVRESLSASLNEEESKNPWEEGRLMYEGNPDDVEIEILDLSTSSGINGREPMVERLMSQVRAMFGITDAFENELSETGGLNAEGTQVEITNSAIASAHQDTKDKALDKLCRIIEMVQGHCDWELAYVDPETEDASLSPLEVLRGIEIARETGTKVAVEDGQLQIPDQEIDVEALEPSTDEPPDESGDDSPADTVPDADDTLPGA
ncbi:zinc ribbon domain-containing protein [Natrarchaeobius oligotrophus]|uniref:Zinc ribbon domain-containing protein n=1 Tax=Natrarchaeobius chitinivorans TaxID=1679083 RepID=A0A3N6MBD1_NATCH|nr:zinc ribbon domain-containing protein [Natrarchaeobius chitinivorans]RQG93740.1 zinc ribbon domain-containing protein [Natrarchaeobius chitinivorans]